MQEYEQNRGQEEPVAEQPVKPSPFANSPYMMQNSDVQNTTYIEERNVQEIRPVQKQQSRKRPLPIVLIIVLVVVSLLSLTAAGVMLISQHQTAEELQAANEAIDQLQKRVDALSRQQNAGNATDVPDEDNVQPEDGILTPAGVYAKNVDAVVAISNQATTTNIFGQISQTASSGSGFIISSDGYVISNYHVVSGATTLKVITSDGTEYPATLVGYDAGNDISVLKIEGKNLPYVQLGSSDALAVGERVAAIGNPLGELTSTLTVGYVSAKDRSVNTDGNAINMLQTDAAINSGNSGGPLFNMHGEVVGITTAKYSGTSGSGATIEGIGFAIPIDDVKHMIEDICEKGYVSGAYLGVMVQDVSREAQEDYGFPAGALIMEVTEGYCAKKAGIQEKDVITAIDGKRVDSVAGLTKVLRDYEAGDAVQVTIYRSGTEMNISLVLDERPASTPDQTQPTPDETQPDTDDDAGGEWFDDWFGGFWPFG